MPSLSNAELGIEFPKVIKHPVESPDDYELRVAQLQKEFDEDLSDCHSALILSRERLQRAKERDAASVVKSLYESPTMMEVFCWRARYDPAPMQRDYAISACFRKLESLETKLDQLLLALNYAPGGPGALAAQEDFEQRAGADDDDSGDACGGEKRVQ